MDVSFLVVTLSMGTILAVLVFAMWSKHRTEKRMENDDAPKSTLAADAPNK
ncbi:hypothetical protein [Tropicimonas sp. S265A]|uniref:hypothetical protein n=1 Tax=Tropicimonas sp. S265A TaxID=3415134 RepID=UPI003C79C285